MAQIQIKITELPSIGSNVAGNTLLPVVNTAGTAITEKATTANLGNFILTNAGTTLTPAYLANLAYSVVNAAQPNITSVGTLSVNTLKISGGDNGYYLQTDGGGNLAWVASGGSGNGEVGGSNSQIQFNLDGSFAGDPELTWDAGNNQLNTVNFAASTATIYGNLNVINVNATGNLVPNAIYTDNYFYANGYVFGGGGGNGVPGGANTQIQFNDGGVFGGNTGFTFNKTTGIFSSPYLAGNGNGLSNIQGANVSGAVGLATYAGTANAVAGANVSGEVSYAGTANSVAVANVVGLGNIATVALNGNGSQYLRGNGTWGSVGSTPSEIANGTSNVNIPTSSGAVEVTAGTQHWAFGTDGTLTAPNDSQIVPAGNNFNLYTNGVNGAVQFFTDVTGNNHNWSFDGYGYTNLPFSQGYSNTAVIATNGAGNIMLQAGAGPTYNFLFSSDGRMILPGSGVIVNPTGAVNVVSSDFAQLQWADPGNINITDPNDSTGPKNWVYVESGGVFIETNINNGGNTQTWNFNNNGNTAIPGNVTMGTGNAGVILQSNTDGFGIDASITGITNGLPTVLVTLNNVEFPGPVSGSVKITGVLGETEANGFWGWQAVDVNVIQLFTDSTLSTPVDGTTWNAYTGGGLAIASGYNNLDIIGGNVAIHSGAGKYWSFNPDGGFVPPTMTIDLHNGGNQQAQVLQLGNPSYQAVITGPTPTYNSAAQRLIIQGQRGSGLGEGGDVYLWGGDSDVNGGDIKIYAGDADVSGYGGYINLDAGSGVNGGGQLSLTGGSSSTGPGGSLNLYAGNGDSAGIVNIQGGQAGNVSYDGGAVNITGGYGYGNGGQVTITGGQSALGLPGYANVVINAGASSWTFDNTGNLTIPSNIITSGAAHIKTFNGLVDYQFTNSGLFIVSDGTSFGSAKVKAASGSNVALSSNDETNQVVADNTKITVTANTSSWLFEPNGSLTLPTISLGSGVDEQAVVQSQRKVIPPYRYSAVIDGATPTIVYTANQNSLTLKTTLVVQHAGLGFEMFDVSAISAGANVMYSVSNRLNATGQPDTTVVVDWNSTQLAITLTVNSGATTSWVTYDSTEFGIAVD